MDEVEFYLQDLKSKFKKINPKEYYLSYSGGKDSHFLYWFIKEYLHDNDIEIVSCNTYMEHHEIRERMYKYADRILQPKMKPFEIKEKYGIPCFSKMQDDMIHRYQKGSRAPSVMQFINGTKNADGLGSWFKLNNQAKELLLSNKLHKVSPLCCKYLKKEPFKEYEKESGKKAILGVRGNESKLRQAQYKSCFTKDKKFTPLHDLTDELLNQIYQRYNIEIPKVYDYVKRTGCMGCPYGSHYGDTKQELELLNENQFKFVTEYFKESYEVLGIKTDEVQMKLF
jgi:3'-phosphoadenosine 5'-phosphosulfate sulfotransferase (PAPS reductase)/FAD synthetase